MQINIDCHIVVCFHAYIITSSPCQAKLTFVCMDQPNNYELARLVAGQTTKI